MKPVHDKLAQTVSLDRYSLGDAAFRASCRAALDADGLLVLPGFLTAAALDAIRAEAAEKRRLAYFCAQRHNVYLTPADPAFPPGHARNREVDSSKGCITDDQVANDSALRTLYDDEQFREFLCSVLGEQSLYEYADPLSSINVHYAGAGQELGWHFDNSSFAITLLIQEPESGGQFEFVRAVRNADQGEMNFDAVNEVLDGARKPGRVTMKAGTLVLFRGRDALHRVTPVVGGTTRVLVVLAYNARPGIALSESARLTFYGRLG